MPQKFPSAIMEIVPAMDELRITLFRFVPSDRVVIIILHQHGRREGAYRAE